MLGFGSHLGCLFGKAHACVLALGVVVLVAMAFLACKPAAAFANDSVTGAASDIDASGNENVVVATQADADFYAVLHDSGELVFQREAPANDAGVQGVKAIYEGSLSGYSNDTKVPWRKSARSIKSVRFASDFAALQPQSLAFWFSGCANMTSIDLTNLDASKSTTMRQMFLGCSSLVTVAGLSGFDTSSSTYFGGMFRDCSSLKSLDVSHFDASHVGVLCFMFNGCSSLETLNMSGEGWRTSSLYLMVHVWEGCSSLKSLDLSYLDTSGVHSMARDFNGCTSLEYLDLSGADTTHVGTMTEMFEGCESLSVVKLGSGFTFNGSSANRQCQLPDGNWKSSATGEVFTSKLVPNCVAATYTKVKDAATDSEKPEGSGENAGTSDGGNKNSGTDDGSNNNVQPGDNSKASASKTAKPEKSDSAATGLAVGQAGKVGGATYRVLANGSKAAVAFQKAPKAKTKVIVPASVLLNGKRYAVAGISKSAFKGAAAKVLILKTETLTKKRVKGCFKGATKLKTVKVLPACVKEYEGFFKKANSGKRVSVS